MKYLADLFRARLGSPDTLRGQLVRGGVGSLAINIVHNFLTLAVTVLLARTLGPAGYGIYAYVYAMISLLAVPAQFGLPPLIVRETARGQATKEWGVVKGVVRWGNAIAIFVSATVVAIVVGTSSYFSDFFSTKQLSTLAWGLALMPLLVLGNLRGAALRGLRKVVQGQLPEKIIRPGLFVILILATGLLFSNDGLSAPMAMAMHTLAALVAFVVGAVLLHRLRPVEIVSATPAYETRRWIITVLPLALTAGMHLVNTYADILMLGYFGSAADVGVYRVSVQGAVLVTFGISAIDMVVAPYIARLHTQGEMKRLQKLVTVNARFGAIIGSGIFVTYVFFGDIIIIFFFGIEFAPGWAALAILAFGRLLNSVAGPVVFLLNMTGHERVMARGVAIATVSNIFLNLILIPRFGMEGAAAATAVTLVIWNFLLWRSAQDLLGIDSSAFGLTSAKIVDR